MNMSPISWIKRFGRFIADAARATAHSRWTITACILAYTLTSIAVPLVAYAQTSTSGIPSSEVNLKVGECDPSMNLLNAILSGGGGQTFDDDFEGEGIGCRAGSWVWQGDTPMGAVAKLFLYANTLAMIFGSALLIYIMVVGTLKSAEDGEVLGRSWSTLWVPLRATIGFAALVPTSSGFSWVQIAVLWMATQGIGAGNYLWSNTVKDMFDNPGELVAIRTADAAGVTNLMRNVLKGEVCVRYLNNQAAQANPEAAPGSAQAQGPYSRWVKQNANGGSVIRWGHTTMGFYKTSECGSVEIENRDTLLNPANAFYGNLLRAQQIVQEAQSRAIISAANSMSEVADILAAAPVDGQETSTEQEEALQAKIVKAVFDASNRYRREIAKNASEGVGTLNRFTQSKSLSEITSAMTQGVVDDASRNGWIGAGAFYFTLANVNSKINELTSSVPDVEGADVSEDTESFSLPAHINNRIDSAFNPSTMKAAEFNPGDSEFDDIIGDTVSGWKNSANRFGYESIFVDPSNDKHAIVQIKNVGDTLVGIGETIILAVGAQQVAGKASAFKTTFLTGAFGLLSDMVDEDEDESDSNSSPKDNTSGAAYIFGVVILGALMVFAIMMAYWIPFAPFVIWITSVFGWVVSIMEMLGASFLWAVAHLHPDGEGMASKWGANGYMIIIEVVLRPALMIMGLVLAFAVTDPFLRFTSAMFFKAMSVANQDNFSALIGFVCYLGIYVGLMVAIIHKSHALIHLIPNAIFKWIGAHANSYDDGATAHDVQNKVSGYLMKVGSVGSQAAPGAAVVMSGGSAAASAARMGGSRNPSPTMQGPRSTGRDNTAP